MCDHKRCKYLCAVLLVTFVTPVTKHIQAISVGSGLPRSSGSLFCWFSSTKKLSRCEPDRSCEIDMIVSLQGQWKRSSFSGFGWTINCKNFSSQVILYTDILYCLYLECNVRYIFHANSENVPKLAYLGI